MSDKPKLVSGPTDPDEYDWSDEALQDADRDQFQAVKRDLYYAEKASARQSALIAQLAEALEEAIPALRGAWPMVHEANITIDFGGIIAQGEAALSAAKAEVKP